MSLATKMCFYRAFIPPTLLYGCESWPTTKAQEDKLNVFHMRCLRRILGVSIRHRLRNEHIAARCGIQQVPALISLARMRWAGHLIRMGNERLPKKIVFGALAEGKRGRGKPRKRLAESMSRTFTPSLRPMGLPPRHGPQGQQLERCLSLGGPRPQINSSGGHA